MIREFLPFTSRDADFYRRSHSVKLPIGWKQMTMPTKGRMRLVAEVLSGPEEQKAEILRSVNGLSASEVEAHGIPIPYQGKQVVVLTPVALFQAKLANLRTLPQDKRQDLKHLKLLRPVAKCFLRELLLAAQSPERPQQAIDWMNQHVRNITESISDSYLTEVTSWSDALPTELMANHPSEAVVNFYNNLPDLG